MLTSEFLGSLSLFSAAMRGSTSTTTTV